MFHCWLVPLAVMSFLVCVVSTLHGSLATAFFEQFSLLKTTQRRNTHQDIIHSSTVRGGTAFLISSPWLLSWWEFKT